MVNVKFQFSINQSVAKAILNRIISRVKRGARNNFADLRPLVEEAIDEAVEKRKGGFIPTDGEAEELGIGDGGSIDRGKTNLAWTALKASERAGVTRFSVRKKGAEGTDIIGEIKISIDESAFYTAPRSIVDTPDSDIGQIPWMQWFIEGKTIQGDTFTNQAPRDVLQRVSRTGGGIMIFGGLWQFTGKGRQTFTRLVDEARLITNRKLKSRAAARILRRLR